MELIALLMGQVFRKMKVKHVVISKIGIIVASSIFILLCRKITKEDYPDLRIWCWYNAACGIGYYYLGNLYRKYELCLNIFENKSITSEKTLIWPPSQAPRLKKCDAVKLLFLLANV